eukprot:CCRYP_000569-RA/>CCRYP_000569-RA protein AED:0.37 eAED:0.88 QI:0/0/0/1/0/0/2/0/136
MKPYHGKAYPVPKSHKETTIKELNRLCNLGELEFQPELEWASPSFITAKQDGTECFLTDFREAWSKYYRDLWARRSEVLAPFTSLVGECGHTKVPEPARQRNVHGTGTWCIKKHSMTLDFNCQECSLSLPQLFNGI